MPYIETLWCFLGVASGTVVEMFRRSFGRGYVLEREFSEEFRKEIEDAEKLREENRRARLAVEEKCFSSTEKSPASTILDEN